MCAQENLSFHYPLYSNIASQLMKSITLNTKLEGLKYCQAIYLIATRLISLTLQLQDLKILNVTLTYLIPRKLILITTVRL